MRCERWSLWLYHQAPAGEGPVVRDTGCQFARSDKQPKYGFILSSPMQPVKQPTLFRIQANDPIQSWGCDTC